jgi:hypothetical protein
MRGRARIHALGQWHGYVTGYVRQNERIFHFTSQDGETWETAGDVNQPFMDLANWHNFFCAAGVGLTAGNRFSVRI